MNRRNGVPISGAIQDCFYCAPCTMPVPIQPGTQTRGGVYQDSVMRCTSTIVPIYLPQRGLSVIARPARTDPAEKGRTGATPPFLPLVRHAERGGVSGSVSIGVSPHPPLWGSLPSFPFPPCQDTAPCPFKPSTTKPSSPQGLPVFYLTHKKVPPGAGSNGAFPVSASRQSPRQDPFVRPRRPLPRAQRRRTRR